MKKFAAYAIYTGKKSLALAAAAAFLCTGCAKKQEDSTFVYLDVGYVDSEADFQEMYGDDTTFVAVTGFATPEPVTTPAPTPEPTPEPTRRPRREKEKKEENKENKKEEDKPKEEKPEKSRPRTPYRDKYTKESLSYESSSDGISFESTTLDGGTVSQRLMGKAGITMVNIWTTS